MIWCHQMGFNRPVQQLITGTLSNLQKLLLQYPDALVCSTMPSRTNENIRANIDRNNICLCARIARHVRQEALADGGEDPCRSVQIVDPSDERFGACSSDDRRSDDGYWNLVTALLLDEMLGE